MIHDNNYTTHIPHRWTHLHRSFLLLSLILFVHYVGGEEGTTEQKFFYLNDPDAGPIKELGPTYEGDVNRPDLIYDDKRIRLIEYYAPWCPHCQHLKSHFIKFAKQLVEAAKPYGVEISIHAISCVTHRPVCKEQNVTGYPRIKLYKAGAKNGTEVDPWKLHPFHVLRQAGVQIDMDAESEQIEIDNEKVTGGGDTGDSSSSRNQLRVQQQQEQQEEDGSDRFFLPRTKQDVFNDAYLSFDFAMRNAIFIGKGPLSNQTKGVLERWIDLLQSTLPPTWNLQNMISDLESHMEEVVQSEENLIRIVDKYPPPKSKWSPSCTRGDKYAGYTCGLWELFHIMSVGLLEWNQMVIGDDWAYYATEDAAVTLRNYIEQFFGCEECRFNFLHEFDTCALDRCHRLIEGVGDASDWAEFPIWLFETHNAVNARLLRERTEREEARAPTRQEQINVQWPPKSDCPACWHSDGRWGQDEVLAYLRLTYWYVYYALVHRAVHCFC